MTVIISFAVLGFLLLCSFLFIGFWDFTAEAEESVAADAVKQMVKLEGLAFPGAAVFSDDSDYRLLLTRPELRGTARKLRRSRRELSLAWIAMLRTDLKSLYRFRRFLVEHGASAGLGEELKIAGAFLLTFLLLEWGELVVRIAGPYAMRSMGRRVRAVVDLMSYAPALALSRIPRSSWPELQQSWAGGRA